MAESPLWAPRAEGPAIYHERRPACRDLPRGGVQRATMPAPAFGAYPDMYIKITGSSTSVPTRRNAWVDPEDAASHKVKWWGTIIG